MFRKTIVLFIIMLVLLLLISVFGGSLRSVYPGMPLLPPLEAFEEDEVAADGGAMGGAMLPGPPGPALEDEEDDSASASASIDASAEPATGDVEAFEPATIEGGFAAF